MKADYELIFQLVILFLGASILPGFGQTVGNGTVITPSSIIIGPSAGQREFAGSSAGANNSFSSEAGVGDYATRHYTNRGETSGIGGSFIGTASPTSESSPAIIVSGPRSSTTPQFRLPNLNSNFGAPISTPALEMYTPAIPASPKLGTLSNPFDPITFRRDYNRTQLEQLPSFSTQPSFIQNSQFDQFGSQ
jgi:hypothetical protein